MLAVWQTATEPHYSYMSVWCYWINLCCIHFALMDSSQSLMSRNSQQAITEDTAHKWMGPIIPCSKVLGPFLNSFLGLFFLLIKILFSSIWIRRQQNKKADTFQAFTDHPAFILIKGVQRCQMKGSLSPLMDTHGAGLSCLWFHPGCGSRVCGTVAFPDSQTSKKPEKPEPHSKLFPLQWGRP